jgi:hypothetical protein
MWCNIHFNRLIFLRETGTSEQSPEERLPLGRYIADFFIQNTTENYCSCEAGTFISSTTNTAGLHLSCYSIHTLPELNVNHPHHLHLWAYALNLSLACNIRHLTELAGVAPSKLAFLTCSVRISVGTLAILSFRSLPQFLHANDKSVRLSDNYLSSKSFTVHPTIRHYMV